MFEIFDVMPRDAVARRAVRVLALMLMAIATPRAAVASDATDLYYLEDALCARWRTPFRRARRRERTRGVGGGVPRGRACRDDMLHLAKVQDLERHRALRTPGKTGRDGDREIRRAHNNPTVPLSRTSRSTRTRAWWRSSRRSPEQHDVLEEIDSPRRFYLRTWFEEENARRARRVPLRKRRRR